MMRFYYLCGVSFYTSTKIPDIIDAYYDDLDSYGYAYAEEGIEPIHPGNIKRVIRSSLYSYVCETCGNVSKLSWSWSSEPAGYARCENMGCDPDIEAAKYKVYPRWRWKP